MRFMLITMRPCPCCRVLVLDSGTIAEFDSPDKLMDDKYSIFYGMVKEANEAPSQHNRQKMLKLNMNLNRNKLQPVEAAGCSSGLGCC